MVPSDDWTSEPDGIQAGRLHLQDAHPRRVHEKGHPGERRQARRRDEGIRHEPLVPGGISLHSASIRCDDGRHRSGEAAGVLQDVDGHRRRVPR